MYDPRDDLVRAARGWVGIPYRDKGRNRLGVDCVGVLIKSAHEVGITDYDTLNYPRRPVPQDFLRELKGLMDRIQKRDAGHGDVMVFREPRHPCHVGILDIDERARMHVIHAYAPARKVVREPMSRERWDRAVMAFRIPGIE